MNEREQADYYEDQKARGIGAFRHKHGLGFSGDSVPRSSDSIQSRAPVESVHNAPDADADGSENMELDTDQEPQIRREQTLHYAKESYAPDAHFPGARAPLPHHQGVPAHNMPQGMPPPGHLPPGAPPPSFPPVSPLPGPPPGMVHPFPPPMYPGFPPPYAPPLAGPRPGMGPPPMMPLPGMPPHFPPMRPPSSMPPPGLPPMAGFPPRGVAPPLPPPQHFGGPSAASSSTQPPLPSGAPPPSKTAAPPLPPAPPPPSGDGHSASKKQAAADAARLDADKRRAEEVARHAEEIRKMAEDERRRVEEERRRVDEERRKRVEEEYRKKRVAEAWTAHKSEEGLVYYYNSVTKDSSWQKPADFIGDVEEVEEAPVPVAIAPVTGCDWGEVRCSDGRMYYYNSITKETSWSVPEQVIAARAKEREARAKTLAEMAAAAINQRTRTAAVTARVANQMAGHGGTSGSVPWRSNGGQTGVGSRGERDRAVTKFKELMLEKGLTPFSRWEKELAKWSADSRWPSITAVINAKDRRSLFEECCVNVAAEAKAMKERAAREAEEGFAELLDEALTLEARIRRDARESGDEQEEAYPPPPSLEGFEDPDTSGAALTMSLNQLEKYWGNDSRWKAVGPDQRSKLFDERFGTLQRVAKEQREAVRSGWIAGLRSLLRERGIRPGIKFSRVKDTLPDDPRFSCISKSEREELYSVVMEEIAAAEAGAAEGERRAAAAASEAERRTVAAERDAAERTRKAQISDAVNAFKALLGEVVRDPEASWREWSTRLEKDPQGRASNPYLERADMESMFREHVSTLFDRVLSGFKELCDQRLRPLMTTPGDTSAPALNNFTAAEVLLGDDPRWQKMPSGHREKSWRRVVDDLAAGRPLVPLPAPSGPVAGGPDLLLRRSDAPLPRPESDFPGPPRQPPASTTAEQWSGPSRHGSSSSYGRSEGEFSAAGGSGRGRGEGGYNGIVSDPGDAYLGRGGGNHDSHTGQYSGYDRHAAEGHYESDRDYKRQRY